MSDLEIICAIGWVLALAAAYVLFVVSRSLGRAARTNRDLQDKLRCAEQGERFWRALAQPDRSSGLHK